MKELKTTVAVIAGIILIFIILQADFTMIFVQIKAIPFSLLIILFGLQIISQLALNYQWYSLSKSLGLKTSFRKLLVINSYGMVADAVTPGEKVGGEIARTVQLSSYLGYTTNQSTALVTIQKSLSLMALVLLNMLALVFMANKIPFLKPLAAKIVLFAFMILLIALFVSLLFYTSYFAQQVIKIKSERKWAKILKNWMNEFAQHTQAISKRPRIWIFQLLLSLGIWALFPYKLFLLISFYTSEISLLALFGITFISYFAAMIPLLPGGLGTFEATMSGMIIQQGLLANQALGISLIFRFVTFWFVIIFSLGIIGVYKISLLCEKKVLNVP